ncbi:hypothetical protein G6F57_022093 [Rhizopus arrhizus]|nr:hypothetical protein G6F57_022093 [Rhizopus arrhizus]
MPVIGAPGAEVEDDPAPEGASAPPPARPEAGASGRARVVMVFCGMSSLLSLAWGSFCSDDGLSRPKTMFVRCDS